MGWGSIYKCILCLGANDMLRGLDPSLTSNNLDLIISNFINNSILHGFESQEEGNITVAVSVSKQKVTLRYIDDGIGMNEEMLKKIYEPFVTSKRNRGGSGLGMNIVYNLVTQVLEGDIDCQSAPDEGIEINISFPVDICEWG